MKAQRFASVFDAVSDTPREAANMKARAELMAIIRERVQSWNLPQDEAAARLELTRPRLNDLLRGKISKFSLDALFNAASAAGLDVHIDVPKQKVKRAKAVA